MFLTSLHSGLCFVDLLAILPAYTSILIPGAESLLVIRALRLLRVFRIHEFARLLGETSLLGTALLGCRRKITEFLGAIAILATILGAAMDLVEGTEHGFANIPIAIYGSIVTMTTVGHGDNSPQTVAGKTLAEVVMILG
jgi:voltage-gated potassium channel